MCGIVGYIGEKNAKEIIIEGLKKLEYRGYDSSGIALYKNGKIEVRKRKGRISNLEELIENEKFDSKIGIGHTRWATHGEPSDANAHPHIDDDNTLAVVHNGIIENYVELKKELSKEYGIVFKSDTDTEVIAHLISKEYKGNLFEAVNSASDKMKGAYAIGVISSLEPDKIIAVRKDAPLIVGLGENCNFIASDIPALLKHARKIYLIENNETVIVTKTDVKIFNAEKKEVKRDVFNVTWDSDSAEKDGYDHFMLKEIHEQPKVVADLINRKVTADYEINLESVSISKKDLEKIKKIYIVACGTAYHAGIVGKYAIERFAKIPVEVDVASEFRYRDPFIDKNTLLIVITQSGETLDTLAALREAKSKGARVLSIVNVVGSSVARESDDVLYSSAGPEIAVASTKAYTTQLACMYLIGLYLAKLGGKIDIKYYKKIIDELRDIPEKMQEIIMDEEKIRKIARENYKIENVFFIGRGLDTGVSYEGSLKLKEISYINSFAIAAGELKHGTIALIEQGTMVIALATQDALFEKMLSNIQEVKARGAYIIGVTKKGNTRMEEHTKRTLYIPKVADELTSLLCVIPLQILAYYIAKLRGCDIDKPKNLAKSVTVE